MNEKIGHIYTCLVNFQKDGKIKIKQRPVLIIGQADKGDYTALPISKISHKGNVNKNYDIPIAICEYPNLNLTVDSYIRTSKIFTPTNITLYKDVSNLKEVYPILYEDVISKFKEYTQSVVENA